MKMKRILASILCVAMVLSTMGFTAFAEDTDIIEVGADKTCTTWSAAVAAANDANDDKTITYHIYGKVEVDSTAVWVSPIGTSGATTINFVGMTDDAEISITAERQIVATDGISDMVAINYTGLILSRPNGSWTGDLAHANQFFTTWMRGAADGIVTYTNCTFLNGVCANTYNETTFTNCTFNNPTSNALWIMGGDVDVVGGTFTAAKGVKTYNDNPATVINAYISGATFDIEQTPAVIASAIGDVVLEEIDTTACDHGAVENGVAGGDAANVTIDGEAPVYVASATNKYGVVVYTTDVEYAETVKDAAIANGRESEVSVPVALVNSVPYSSLTDAIADLEEGDTLKISSGTYDSFDVLVDNVTITGMTDDAEITINSITHNAFIGIKANGVTVENLNFIVPENCVRTGDWMDMFDAVIGYWSNNFNSGSAGITGYDVKNCSFVNEGSDIGIAIFNFDNFEISGNTFENFNTGVTAMQDGSAMGAVAINDNTFTKVNEPVNVYWGHTGDDDNSIAITGNNFVSAKDADEVKITVHDYASTVEGTSGIDAIDLSGNTYSAATEVVLVDAAATVTTEATEDLANAGNVALTSRYDSAARIGNVYYADLHAAISAAQSGETVEVLKDVTVDTWNSIYPAENLTINGNNKTLTVNTVDSGINGGGLFLNATGLTIKDWTVNLPDTQNNSERPRLAIMNSGTLENITVNGGTHAVSVKGDVEITNCAFEGQSGWIIETENAPAEAALTIEDSTFAGKAVILRGQNNTFIGNKITNDGDGVNVLGDAVIIDNDFGESTLGIDTGVNVTVEKNIINDVEFTTWLGAEDYSNVTVENNKLSDAAVDAFNEKLEEEVASVEPPIEIDGEIYFTLTDAIAAAEQGAALTLVADAEITTADYNNIISKEITLTLGSYTLIASNALADTDFITVQNGYEVKKTRRDGVYVYSVAKRETTTTPDRYYPTYGGSMITTKKEEPKKNLSDFPFTDVKTDFWGYEGIAYCWQNNIMNGMTNTAFEPETPLSRAMLVTMLYRFAGSPKVTTTEKEWYSAARVWAMNSGISDGTNMNNTITREQLAAMLCRYASKKGKDTGTGADLTVFNDAANISGWAHTSVSWAVRNGLIKGMGNGTLSPNSGATRAEVATIMQRFIEFSK